MDPQPTPAPLQIGDPVVWTQAGGSGRILSLRLRKGIITAVHDGRATVKPHGSGKSVLVPLDQLERERRKTILAEVVEARREAVYGKPAQEGPHDEPA